MQTLENVEPPGAIQGDVGLLSDQIVSVPTLRPLRPAGTSSYGYRRFYNAALLLFGDVLILSGSILAANLWIGDRPLVVPTLLLIVLLLPVWLTGAMLTRLLPGWGLGPIEELRRLIILTTLTYSVGGVILFGIGWPALPDASLPAAWIVSLVLIPFIRIRIKRLAIALGWWGTHANIYGTKAGTTAVLKLLEREQGFGFIPSGIMQSDDVFSSAAFAQHRGGTRTSPASVAILALEGLSREQVIDLLEGPMASYRSLILVPDFVGLPSLWVRTRDFNGVLGLEITCNLADPFARVLKRTIDLAIVVALSPVWVPLCLLIAGLIWLEDRSPALFRQERVKQGGQPFYTLKFRTMVPDAERVLRDHLERDEALRQEWNAHFKLRHDPRITNIGRLLRKTSLDELPQLLNVLQGDMSLVGPRPLPAYHNAALPPRVRELRERVRPGITGMWQVSGRSDAGTKGMELHDPYYVRNWSPWLDGVILVRTARTVFRGTGAY